MIESEYRIEQTIHRDGNGLIKLEQWRVTDSEGDIDQPVISHRRNGPGMPAPVTYNNPYPTADIAQKAIEKHKARFASQSVEVNVYDGGMRLLIASPQLLERKKNTEKLFGYAVIIGAIIAVGILWASL